MKINFSGRERLSCSLSPDVRVSSIYKKYRSVFFGLAKNLPGTVPRNVFHLDGAPSQDQAGSRVYDDYFEIRAQFTSANEHFHLRGENSFQMVPSPALE